MTSRISAHSSSTATSTASSSRSPSPPPTNTSSPFIPAPAAPTAPTIHPSDSSHQQAATLLAETRELEKQLRSLQRGPSVTSEKQIFALRKTIRHHYRQVIYLDLPYAAANDVEQNLWKYVFYKQIEELRKLLKQYQPQGGQGGGSQGGAGHHRSSSAKDPNADRYARLSTFFRQFLRDSKKFYRSLLNYHLKVAKIHRVGAKFIDMLDPKARHHEGALREKEKDMKDDAVESDSDEFAEYDEVNEGDEANANQGNAGEKNDGEDDGQTHGGNDESTSNVPFTLPDQSTLSPKDLHLMYLALMTCHRSLIFLGDLERYSQLILGQNTPSTNNTNSPTSSSDLLDKDWSKCERYYRWALSIMPTNGNPHNQLAVVATYRGINISAVHRYFRSLAVAQPFATGVANLKLLLERLQISNFQQHHDQCHKAFAAATSMVDAVETSPSSSAHPPGPSSGFFPNSANPPTASAPAFFCCDAWDNTSLSIRSLDHSVIQLIDILFNGHHPDAAICLIHFITSKLERILVLNAQIVQQMDSMKSSTARSNRSRGGSNSFSSAVVFLSSPPTLPSYSPLSPTGFTSPAHSNVFTLQLLLDGIFCTHSALSTASSPTSPILGASYWSELNIGSLSLIFSFDLVRAIISSLLLVPATLSKLGIVGVFTDWLRLHPLFVDPTERKGQSAPPNIDFNLPPRAATFVEFQSAVRSRFWNAFAALLNLLNDLSDNSGMGYFIAKETLSSICPTLPEESEAYGFSFVSPHYTHLQYDFLYRRTATGAVAASEMSPTPEYLQLREEVKRDGEAKAKTNTEGTFEGLPKIRADSKTYRRTLKILHFAHWIASEYPHLLRLDKNRWYAEGSTRLPQIQRFSFSNIASMATTAPQMMIDGMGKSSLTRSPHYSGPTTPLHESPNGSRSNSPTRSPAGTPSHPHHAAHSHQGHSHGAHGHSRHVASRSHASFPISHSHGNDVGHMGYQSDHRGGSAIVTSGSHAVMGHPQMPQPQQSQQLQQQVQHMQIQQQMQPIQQSPPYHQQYGHRNSGVGASLSPQHPQHPHGNHPQQHHHQMHTMVHQLPSQSYNQYSNSGFNAGGYRNSGGPNVNMSVNMGYGGQQYVTMEQSQQQSQQNPMAPSLSSSFDQMMTLGSNGLPTNINANSLPVPPGLLVRPNIAHTQSLPVVSHISQPPQMGSNSFSVLSSQPSNMNVSPNIHHYRDGMGAVGSVPPQQGMAPSLAMRRQALGDNMNLSVNNITVSHAAEEYYGRNLVHPSMRETLPFGADTSPSALGDMTSSREYSSASPSSASPLPPSDDPTTRGWNPFLSASSLPFNFLHSNALAAGSSLSARSSNSSGSSNGRPSTGSGGFLAVGEPIGGERASSSSSSSSSAGGRASPQSVRTSIPSFVIHDDPSTTSSPAVSAVSSGSSGPHRMSNDSVNRSSTGSWGAEVGQNLTDAYLRSYNFASTSANSVHRSSMPQDPDVAADIEILESYHSPKPSSAFLSTDEDMDDFASVNRSYDTSDSRPSVSVSRSTNLTDDELLLNDQLDAELEQAARDRHVSDPPVHSNNNLYGSQARSMSARNSWAAKNIQGGVSGTKTTATASPARSSYTPLSSSSILSAGRTSSIPLNPFMQFGQTLHPLGGSTTNSNRSSSSTLSGQSSVGRPMGAASANSLAPPPPSQY